jgi:hypothetical protein
LKERADAARDNLTWAEITPAPSATTDWKKAHRHTATTWRAEEVRYQADEVVDEFAEDDLEAIAADLEMPVMTAAQFGSCDRSRAPQARCRRGSGSWPGPKG